MLSLAGLVSKVMNEETFVKVTIASIASTVEMIPADKLKIIVERDIDPLRVLKIPHKILMQSYEVGMKFRGKGLSKQVTVDAVISHIKKNTHKEILSTPKGREWLRKWFIEPIQVFLR